MRDRENPRDDADMDDTRDDGDQAGTEDRRDRTDEEAAPTRAGSNVPNAGRNPDEGRHE